MNLTPELETFAKLWANTDDYNNAFHAELAERVNRNPTLKAHRDFVEKEQWGFGDRPFHHVWLMLVDQMPATFDFLEIGVFKGQTTSLVALLAKHMGKTARVTGVTTLQNTPDERCKYPQGDYLAWIQGIHRRFNVEYPKLVVGKSNDQHVLKQIGAMNFDVVYVDGSHDYPIVVQDIDNYGQRVRVGGFLVMDDASIGRLNIGSCWPGLEDVARAVKEQLDGNPKFRFLFACGHLNVFQKVTPPETPAGYDRNSDGLLVPWKNCE